MTMNTTDCGRHLTGPPSSHFTLFAPMVATLALWAIPGRAEEAFPFTRDFKFLHGAKVPVRVGDDGADEIAFTPDSRQLLARKGARLTLWDIRGRKKAGTWEADLPEGFSFTSVALTPDGKGVVLADRGLVTLYDLATHKKVRSWPIPEKGYALQVVCGEGGLIALATQSEMGRTDGAVHVWALADKGDEPRHSFSKVHEAYRSGGPILAFLPGQKRLLVSGGNRGEAALIALDTKKTEKLKAAGSLVAASRDGAVWMAGLNVWSRDTRPRHGDPVGQLKLPWNHGRRAYTLCPKGRFLAAVCRKDGASEGVDAQELLVWEVRRDDEHVAFKGCVWISNLPGKTWKASVAFSPDGAHLAVASDKEILVWDARALLPVTDPVLLNQDLMDEIRELRERVGALERRVRDLESKK